MATLLQFRRPDEGARKSSAKRQPRRCPSAEIVIFPGVRIERQRRRPDDRSRALLDGSADTTGETA